MRAILYPFSLAPGGKLADTSDYAQIVRGQIIDALMTNLGERVFRPRYGCDIQAALFDPSDELVRRDAAGQIKHRLEQLVTRAIIRSVTVTPADPEPGAVTVRVIYRPALYATDAEIAVPVASEFLNRQRAIPIGEI
jgi:phage baseplate assembly protein W